MRMSSKGFGTSDEMESGNAVTLGILLPVVLELLETFCVEYLYGEEGRFGEKIRMT